MRIAIIGSGIAGLTAAHRLAPDHEVVLYEAADRLGGHTATIDVHVAGRDYAVDTGFIVYNDWTYPQFIALLDELGIRGAPTDMSFAMSCDRSGHEYSSRVPFGLFARPGALFSPGHWRMLWEILRFNRIARGLVGRPSGRSLAQFATTFGFSARFQRHYLYPLCASIWSGSIEDARRFPADHFIDFFHGHGLLTVFNQPQWRYVPGGSREYVRAIAARLGDRVRTACPVGQVRRSRRGVEIDSPAGTETYDHAVLACHSDQALALLDEPSPLEAELLGQLHFQDNDVVLHTDTRLLPRRRAAWASWNFQLGDDDAAPAPITYHMNRLQCIEAPVEFCVTLNRTDQIDPDRILGRYTYAHPVYTTQSNAVRARLDEINGVDRISYCGAWRYNGFHEDGVRSALDVVGSLSRTERLAA